MTMSWSMQGLILQKASSILRYLLIHSSATASDPMRLNGLNGIMNNVILWLICSSQVLQGLRAIFVFMISSALFCDSSHPEQCFTATKSVSSVIVVLGSMLYAWATTVAAREDKKEEKKKKEMPSTYISEQRKQRAPSGSRSPVNV